jgi:cytochrome b561
MMQWKNTPAHFGALAKIFHWTAAAAFIGAYIVVYYVIWFMDDRSPEALPVLNIHWALGLLVGALVLPRLVWRLLNVQPDEVPGSSLEHALATVAHWGLYGLMILLPLTGYLGTGAPTRFGLFSIPSFRETAMFERLSAMLGTDWEQFEAPVDAVHHFVGEWIAWVIVGLHIAAAMVHHFIRRDSVLRRMLPAAAIGKSQE